MQGRSGQEYSCCQYCCHSQDPRFFCWYFRFGYLWSLFADSNKSRKIDIAALWTELKINCSCRVWRYEMHVFRLCRAEVSCHAWTYRLFYCVSTSLSNSLGRARLFGSWHATWNGRHPIKFMSIAEIRWSSHRHHSSKTLLYRRSQRNRDVPRPPCKNFGYRLKYGILSMW